MNKSTLVFATSNPNKIQEVSTLLKKAKNNFPVLSLKDIGCTEDIPETSPTIEGNALQKARYVFLNYKKDCFSEDTGLEVMALNGEPGVYSARYAGEDRDSNANMDLLQKKLANKNDRSARFKTVIALIIGGKEFTFEGIVNGQITLDKAGEKGFGYDPIFQPDGYDITFAEMNSETKNSISHRGRAMTKLMSFLESL